MTFKGKRSLAGVLGAAALCGGLLLVTPGCGPEAQEVTAPAPTNNAPPGGSDPDEYARKMRELQGGGGGQAGSGSGGAPAPGSPPPEAPPPAPR